MRTEVIQADTIDAAVEHILHELREDSSSRSIRNRENVIYFDGWDGLGASAVLRAVGQRLAEGLQSSEAPTGLQFDQIIHIDCSDWESRRALQRVIVEQLELPALVMEMLDRRDEEDDFHGVPQGSRNEVPEVLDATYQHIQTLSHRFLVIFQNGSSEEMDLTTFGFPLYGYSRNKLLWTFQGSLRLYPRVKVDRVLKRTATTDIFLSASRRDPDQDPLELWRYLVHQEAAQVACRNAAGTGSLLDHLPAALVSECFFYTLKQCCMGSQCMMDYDLNIHRSNYWICDGIIHLQKQGDGDNQLAADHDDCVLWRASDALQREMQLDVDYCRHDRQYFPSPLVKCAEIIPCWTSPSYWVTQILVDATIANRGIFQHYDKLCVLKLSRCSFSFSSPSFLCCRSLRFLWLDHCQDNNQVTSSTEEASAEEEMRCCIQRLWVLDVRYTPCEYWILSPQMMDLMTQLRELNVMGAQDWDVGHLHGRLPNIRKLRVTKSIVRCTRRHSEDDFLSSMNKLELLDFSGNRAMQGGGAEKLFGISTSSNQLENVIIIDGCVGLQKFCFRGCAKLKNLLLSGFFEDLRILDMSGTAAKTLDLSAMTARSLDELILDNCDKLCAILWPPEDKRNMGLPKVHIDTTQSASTSRSGGENLKDGSTAANKGLSSSSWPMVLVNGARPPSEFNWYISVKDARLLRSFVPSFEKYFEEHRVHLEISSPRCCAAVDVGGSENEGIKNKVGEEPRVLSNRQRRQQPQYNKNASMYYANVATTIVEEHLLQVGEGNGNNAPTITRTRPCPPPYASLDSSACYLFTQDQRMKIKATMDDGGAIATIPSIICDTAYILHVHGSMYNTCIPGSARWPSLRWCRVERCPRLDFIFSTPQLGGGSSAHMCWCLTTFWASQLPKTRFMWDTSKLPLSKIGGRSFEELTLLHLDFCPRLIHVLPFTSSVISRRYLETLEIVWCGDLRVAFPLLDTNNTRSHQEQQQKPPGAIITTVDFPCLKHIHLHELPKLQSICGHGGRMYAPRLETIKIRGCWSLRHLPAVRSNRSNDKVECDCEKEWWDSLEWDRLDGKHQPSLYKPVHSRYYKKKLLRGSVLK